MKNPLTIAFLSIIFCACNNQTQKTSVAKKDSISKSVNSIFIVDEPSNYSKVFLDSLRAANYSEPIHLIKDFVIIGKDTIHFPNDLKINKAYNFTGASDSVKYSLIAKRINLTDIVFEYSAKLKDSIIYEEKGSTTLNHMFFLASEVPEDEQTGESYGAYEYFNIKKSNLYSIEIGIGRDDHNLLRALISSTEKTEKKDFPKITLRTP